VPLHRGGRSEGEFRSIDVGPVRCMPRNNDDEHYDLVDEESGHYYNGRAVQVEPMDSMLKAPGTKRLKLLYDEPPSNFAFKSNLRRYTTGTTPS